MEHNESTDGGVVKPPFVDVVRDSAAPLSKFRAATPAVVRDNMTVRYGDTHVVVKLPRVLPLGTYERLLDAFTGYGWGFSALFDSRGVRSGAVTGYRFVHPMLQSLDGTQAPERPGYVRPTIALPDRRVPLTPEVAEELADEARAVTLTLVRNLALNEEHTATRRSLELKLRHDHGLGSTDPAAFPGHPYTEGPNQ